MNNMCVRHGLCSAVVASMQHGHGGYNSAEAPEAVVNSMLH
jgi:hypothetical protein